MSAVAAAAWCIYDIKRDGLLLYIIEHSISEREKETSCKLELFVYSVRVFSLQPKFSATAVNPRVTLGVHSQGSPPICLASLLFSQHLRIPNHSLHLRHTLLRICLRGLTFSHYRPRYRTSRSCFPGSCLVAVGNRVDQPRSLRCVHHRPAAAPKCGGV